METESRMVAALLETGRGRNGGGVKPIEFLFQKLAKF